MLVLYGIIDIQNRTINQKFGTIQSRFDLSRSCSFTFIFPINVLNTFRSVLHYHASCSVNKYR